MPAYFLFLLQASLIDLSVNFLWVVTLILLALTFILFFASIVARTRHWTHEQLEKTYQNKHYPLILEYLGGEITEKEIEGTFRGEGVEFSVFEEIIFEMLENLEGEDADRLRKLLYLSPIFNYHFNQLNASDDVERIKACNYFSHVRLVNNKVIRKLVTFLSSENKMLVFSAASALMASSKVEIREKALSVVARKAHYSRMALLEMVYNFNNNEEEQMEEEAGVLQKLIDDEEVSPKSAAVLIEGASELGYQQLLPFLESKLKSTVQRWRHPEVLKALIRAQGTYYNFEAFPYVNKFISHTDPDVRKAVAFALGRFGDEESLLGLFQMLRDREYEVKVEAAKSLYENGEDGQAWLQESYREQDLNIETIVNTL